MAWDKKKKWCNIQKQQYKVSHKLDMGFNSGPAGTYFTKWTGKVSSQEVIIVFA